MNKNIITLFLANKTVPFSVKLASKVKIKIALTPTLQTPEGFRVKAPEGFGVVDTHLGLDGKPLDGCTVFDFVDV